MGKPWVLLKRWGRVGTTLGANIHRPITSRHTGDPTTLNTNSSRPGTQQAHETLRLDQLWAGGAHQMRLAQDRDQNLDMMGRAIAGGRIFTQTVQFGLYIQEL